MIAPSPGGRGVRAGSALKQLVVDRFDRGHPRLERQLGFDPAAGRRGASHGRRPDREARSRSQRRGGPTSPVGTISAVDRHRLTSSAVPPASGRDDRRSRTPSPPAPRSASPRSPTTARTGRRRDEGRAMSVRWPSSRHDAPSPRRMTCVCEGVPQATAVADDDQPQFAAAPS